MTVTIVKRQTQDFIKAGRENMGKKKHSYQQGRRARQKRPRPVWQLMIMHVVALSIALLIYALPHHVIPQAGVSVGTVSTRGMMVVGDVGGDEPRTNASPVEVASGIHLGGTETVIETPATLAPEMIGEALLNTAHSVQPEATAMVGEAMTDEIPATAEGEGISSATPSPTATLEPVDAVGSFRIKFADKFIEGKAQKTKTTYISENLNIAIYKRRSEELDTTYYVVDIYVADISCFMTAFAQDKFGIGYTDWPKQIARDYKSIITMNGDQYGMRKTGVVIRNGQLYRNKKVTNDVCVLYWDGTVKTFAPGDFNANWEMSNGAYQAWNFGPRLLDDDGNAKTQFNSTTASQNPRSALGYFEPGHYCFVVVDGRNDESDGITLKNLAKLMKNLGCRQAYNMDGGRTSMLYAGDTLLNKPAEGGRKATDVLMIVDYVTE